jgi:MFS family permease
MSLPSESPTTHYFTFQFGLLCLSNLLFSASFNMMIPELPAYLSAMGGAEYKGWIIALFTLMAGISRPFSGKLTDTVGRVPVMIFGSLVCVVCSLLYPALHTITGFLMLRFFHGFSTGFKPTATSAYGADVVHESRRGEALGALAIGYTLGSSIGPLLGSWVVYHYGYNTMFVASAVLAMGSVAILFNIRETLPAPQPFRWSLLRIPKNEIIELTSLRPAIILFLLSVSLGSCLTLVPDYASVLGMQNKGLFFTCFTITSLLIRFIAGKTSDRYGRQVVLFFSSLVMLVGMLVLAFAHSTFILLTGAAIFGLSLGMNSPTVAAWAVDLCAKEHRGKAVATVYIALEAGIGGGALISALIYANQSEHFVFAFLFPALCAALSMLLLYGWMSRSKLETSP